MHQRAWAFALIVMLSTLLSLSTAMATEIDRLQQRLKMAAPGSDTYKRIEKDLDRALACERRLSESRASRALVDEDDLEDDQDVEDFLSQLEDRSPRINETHESTPAKKETEHESEIAAQYRTSFQSFYAPKPVARSAGLPSRIDEFDPVTRRGHLRSVPAFDFKSLSHLYRALLSQSGRELTDADFRLHQAALQRALEILRSAANGNYEFNAVNVPQLANVLKLAVRDIYHGGYRADGPPALNPLHTLMATLFENETLDPKVRHELQAGLLAGLGSEALQQYNFYFEPFISEWSKTRKALGVTTVHDEEFREELLVAAHLAHNYLKFTW